MSPIAAQRYKEIKDWLKIISPLASVVWGSFYVGGLYSDFKAHTQKWDGYGEIIKTETQRVDRRFSEVYQADANFKSQVYNNLLNVSKGEQIIFYPDK